MHTLEAAIVIPVFFIVILNFISGSVSLYDSVEKETFHFSSVSIRQFENDKIWETEIISDYENNIHIKITSLNPSKLLYISDFADYFADTVHSVWEYLNYEKNQHNSER